MTTAFVLSGGGSLGAVQVGMLQSLAERDVQPDLLVGTSAGAVNSAYVAGHGTGRQALDDLAAIWMGLRRRDVFPVDPLRHLLAVAGARPSLCASHALGRLLAAHLPYPRLEDAAIPVHVVATDLLSGREVVLSTGDAVSAVLASAAIPAVFPAVERDGLTLVDGGIADNAAISQAVALGADRVFVLPTGYACALEAPPATPLATALHALSLLIEQRLILEVTHFAERVEVNVLPPLCPLTVASVDFRHAGELIDRARQATGDWLDTGGPALPRPERFLSLHHHDRRSTDQTGSHACAASRTQHPAEEEIVRGGRS
ncbi:MAG: patatin-like phospholipase family protein [Candidatus Rokuibacteriota bacterium]